MNFPLKRSASGVATFALFLGLALSVVLCSAEARGNEVWVAGHVNDDIGRYDTAGNLLGQYTSNNSIDSMVRVGNEVWTGYEFNGLIDRYDTGGNYLGQLGSVTGARGKRLRSAASERSWRLD